MLPSSGRSIGEQSVTTLPANRSIILADSRYRPQNPIDTPYDFNCDLSGTAIYAKEIFYQKLFWNQPLFSHNNGNCELRFSMTGYQMDPDIVFIVYVTPFVIFKEYDGNAPGVSLATPQPFSYAANLEQGLNSDVRTYPFNTTLYNVPPGMNIGVVQDSVGNPIQLRFRYSPSRGFVFYAEPNFLDGQNRYYGIQLRPCSFVQNAHFVHGFGIFDDSISFTEYVPHSFFMTSVYSDCTPNLLPSRYIVVQSQELNKDRRLISFHNGSFASFVNELAIFAVNPAQSGAFHQVGVGDDATVISLRDDYTPQSFRIQILNEFGVPLRCDDPLSAVMQNPGIDPLTAASYINPPIEPGIFPGRGNSDFINFLVFGYQRTFTGITSEAQTALKTTAPFPSSQGMGGANLSSQIIDSVDNIPTSIDLTLSIPFNTLGTWAAFPQQATGFSTTVNPSRPFLNNGATYGYFAQFTWFPSINPFPTFIAALSFTGWTSSSYGSGTGYIVLVMYDSLTFQVIQTANGYSYNLAGLPSSTFPATYSNWKRNPFYIFPSAPSSIQVGFAVGYVAVQPAGAHPYAAQFQDMFNGGAVMSNLFIRNSVDPDNQQADYLPPEIQTQNYIFGDPLSDALCEETLHEIAAVLEYN